MKNQNILKVLKHFLFFLVSFPVIILACEEDNTPTEKDPVDNTFEGSYVIIDTYQNTCYDNDADISAPSKGDDFYGQDAQHTGNLSNFVDNGNGTVTDLTTGLMWMQELPDEKYNYAESVTYAENCTLAGFTDWRLPTIKELYSLIRFDGATGLDQASSIPYIDTGFFEFRFGAEFGERYIDAQYVTSTIYKGTTMDGNETMFGVNFVDGRIKGYPTFKDFEIRLVRGNTNYGINNFIDNGDGTITDANTDLMWDAQGSSSGMNWQEALAWAQQKNADKYLGYDNWRLPNAKELQSIVDYKKSPHTVIQQLFQNYLMFLKL